VLRCIDGAVQFPDHLRAGFDGQTQVVACIQAPERSRRQPVGAERLLCQGWLAERHAERGAMPLALDLGGLYEQLLRALMPLPARPHEALADHVARLNRLAAKQREVGKTASETGKKSNSTARWRSTPTLRRLQIELEAIEPLNTLSDQRKRTWKN
jgi:hypothetical protein